MLAHFGRKTCYHPHRKDCSGPIVRAHTLTRASALAQIARDGHVYSANVRFAALQRQGRPSIDLIGINDASTFYGFCAHHDNLTFAPLEKTAFIPNAEQCFLLAYRPLIRELYLKKSILNSAAVFRDADKGKPPIDQFQIQSFVQGFEEGTQRALLDLESHKQGCDSDLLAANFSNQRALVLTLKQTPELMCSGVVFPLYDFAGSELQRLGNSGARPDVLSFSITGTPGGGAVVFSWRSDSDRACIPFVDSFKSLGEEQWPHAAIMLALNS